MLPIKYSCQTLWSSQKRKFKEKKSDI
jgi:hypothetical protein